MEKINILTFILGSVLLTVSCEEKPTSNPPVVTPIAPIQEVKVIPAPSNIISIQEAENMYHRYGTKTASFIEKSVNTNTDGNQIAKSSDKYVQATRSLSIDYKDLKNYLAYIEQEAGNAKTPISGLRIYFSQYQEGKNNSRATVFLNPLMEYGKKGNILDDVSFAIQKSGKDSKAVAVGSLIKVPTVGSNKDNLKTTSVQNGIFSLALNHFPWSPPPTDDPDDYQ